MRSLTKLQTRVKDGRLSLVTFLLLTLFIIEASGGLVERERLRRQAVVEGATKQIHRGDKALKRRNYKQALAAYKRGYTDLQPGIAYIKVRDSLKDRLVSTTLRHAKQWEKKGGDTMAVAIIHKTLAVLPGHQILLTASYNLSGKAVSSKELSINRHLRLGAEFYNRGELDRASSEFSQILTLDAYNEISRIWLAKCIEAKDAYYIAAYDETRKQHLDSIDEAWLSVPKPRKPSSPKRQYKSSVSGSIVEITNKLKRIIIPVVDFESVSIEEAVAFLRLRSYELDTTTQNPEEKGINFIVRGAATPDVFSNELLMEEDFSEQPSSNVGYISELKLKNVPLAQVLQFICDLAKLRYRVDDYAVTLLPLDVMDASELMTKSWSVAPTFISDLGGVSSPSRINDDPFALQSTRGSGLGSLASAKEVLSRCGIEFKGDAIANYLPASSTLIVRNTINNLDLIDALVEKINERQPKQIRILTKFVEISQEDTDELGFDWNLGIAGSGLALRGGSQGNGQLKNDFAVSDGRTITSGLRSGDGALTRNSIDFILNNSGRYSQQTLSAPGIMSIGGVFGNTQLEVIMRGLAQKKGADIMIAPSIVARSGETAKIEVIRELIYPTEYNPPEVPDSVESLGVFPVTPSTPTAFEVRNTGVTLEIKPTIGEANDSLIDLQFAPEIVEFEGFVNYGSPITGADTDGNTVTITENRIEMPVFSTRRVSTALTLEDGYTVAIGGLMREDVQSVNDKVPILGDLPFVGRFFQSTSESRIKSNLIIFVTAQVIDAKGIPIRGEGRPQNELDHILGGDIIPLAEK